MLIHPRRPPPPPPTKTPYITWELTVNAENLAERLSAAQQVQEQGELLVRSANARITDAVHRLSLERERYDTLEENLRLHRETHDALRRGHSIVFLLFFFSKPVHTPHPTDG